MTVKTTKDVHPVLQWDERTFQKMVVDAARLMGYRQIYHTHNSKRSQPGFPDLVLVSTARKRTLFVELKTMTGKVSPHQEEWIGALREAGQEAVILRPSDWRSRRVHAILSGEAVLCA